MTEDRRRMAMRGRQGTARTAGRQAADPVAERLDRIEAVLASLTPEPIPVGEEFVAGQVEQCRLMRDALDETIARLEGELAELRQGKELV